MSENGPIQITVTDLVYGTHMDRSREEWALPDDAEVWIYEDGNATATLGNGAEIKRLAGRDIAVKTAIAELHQRLSGFVQDQTD